MLVGGGGSYQPAELGVWVRGSVAVEERGGFVCHDGIRTGYLVPLSLYVPYCRYQSGLYNRCITMWFVLEFGPHNASGGMVSSLLWPATHNSDYQGKHLGPDPGRDAFKLKNTKCVKYVKLTVLRWKIYFRICFSINSN